MWALILFLFNYDVFSFLTYNPFSLRSQFHGFKNMPIYFNWCVLVNQLGTNLLKVEIKFLTYRILVTWLDNPPVTGKLSTAPKVSNCQWNQVDSWYLSSCSNSYNSIWMLHYQSIDITNLLYNKQTRKSFINCNIVRKKKMNYIFKDSPMVRET